MTALRPQVLSFAISSIFFASSSFASTVLYESVETMAGRAELILRAKVLKAESRWTATKRKIVTDITLQPVEVLKGEAPSEVIILVDGGVVGQDAQSVVGAPEFQVGQEVVCLLRKRGVVKYEVLGLSQGKFDLAGEGLAKTASRSGAGQELVGKKELKAGGTASVEQLSANENHLYYETLKARIHSVVKAQDAQPEKLEKK
jgi:hypothetical protein